MIDALTLLSLILLATAQIGGGIWYAVRAVRGRGTVSEVFTFALVVWLADMCVVYLYNVLGG